MSPFKFGQIEVASKYFHNKKVTDRFTIAVNKVVHADRVSCNNGKDWCYIVGYKEDRETTIPLFMKTPKNIFSYDVFQYDKNTAQIMSFNVFEVKVWVLHYEVETHLFENLKTEPIKGK